MHIYPAHTVRKRPATPSIYQRFWRAVVGRISTKGGLFVGAGQKSRCARIVAASTAAAAAAAPVIDRWSRLLGAYLSHTLLLYDSNPLACN